MKNVCLQFQQRSLPNDLKLLLRDSLSSELKAVTKAFVELQQERHTADYDVGKSYLREDAVAVVATAERAFRDWNRIPEPEANVFVAALAFGSGWSK
jgi:hypothetical protein